MDVGNIFEITLFWTSIVYGIFNRKHKVASNLTLNHQKFNSLILSLSPLLNIVLNYKKRVKNVDNPAIISASTPSY